jgi:hypothetical protein
VNTTRSLAHPLAGRPGHTVRRRLTWARVRRSLSGRHGAQLLTIVAGTILAVTAVVWSTGERGVWIGFVVGLALMTFLSAIAWLVAAHGGTQPAPVVGAVGESWTVEAFRSLSKRWMEIDGVLLSESGVFAVETRFTSVEWSEHSAGFQSALVAARQRADEIEHLLSGGGRPTVTPVLVIWGPGARSIPGGYETIGEVLVCRGASPRAWIAHLEGLPHVIDPDAVTTMAAVVRDDVQRALRTAGG